MSNTYHNSFFAMNTRCRVVFSKIDHEYSERIFRAIKMEINSIEEKISRFIPEKDLSIVDRSASKLPAILPIT